MEGAEEMSDEVFDEWNRMSTKRPGEAESGEEATSEYFTNFRLNENESEGVSGSRTGNVTLRTVKNTSSNDKRPRTIPQASTSSSSNNNSIFNKNVISKSRLKQEENCHHHHQQHIINNNNQYYQWSTSEGGLLKLPSFCSRTATNPGCGMKSVCSGIEMSKHQNILEVPGNRVLCCRSVSLVNLNPKSAVNNPLPPGAVAASQCFVNDRFVLSVPSSPDSFYCDSLCGSSSSGGDLNSPTSPLALSRSLSAEALPEPGFSLRQSRRSNSSDSAVVMLTDDRTSENNNRKSEADEKSCLPSPTFTFPMPPSVVVSDHSDFYPSFDEYSSFEDSLCGDSHIQYWHQFRKFSDCSSTTSSLASTQSLDEDETEHEQPYPSLDEERCLLPSGWRKVRNIVHWSPFVQTYKKQKYPWVQLAGHKGSFKPGEHGTILKKMCPKEEKCLLRLMNDELGPFVPEYKGRIEGNDDEIYLQLQDLLKDFDDPCVMDCKIGVRTYLEEELSKAKEKSKLRKDMYEKMIQVDGGAATEEEHRMKGVTKPRYMVWRETISSTATLGFRIDGMKRSNGLTSKDFKMTKTLEQVTNSFKIFIDESEHVLPQYVERLKQLRAVLESSKFFKTHELIGSSLLFVHDKTKANVWMIDFAKTQDLPDGISIDHKSPWDVGNHEDGYLIGIDNLIRIFSELIEK